MVGLGKRARQWEEEMLAEYLAGHHRNARVIQRVRLGPITSTLPDPALTEEENRLIGAAWRRWADAVLITDTTLTVLEAGMMPDPGDISRIQVYLALVPSTPELAPYRGRVVKGLLLWAVDDAFSRGVAVRAGLQVEIFKPSNFTEWVQGKRARDKTPPRTPAGLVP